MVKIKYLSEYVRKSDLAVICKAIPILEEYRNAGYRVTLRQLHYQFVARNLAENTKSTYNKICEAMQRGRMAGLIDWDMIEDRTRILRSRPRWDDPADILLSCADCFHTDYWQDQENRVEVWIEKDALLGVIESTCRRWDCAFFSCRGYPSTSELHETARRISRFRKADQGFCIVYCGDHDPSGIDMGHSIVKTLQDFGVSFEFKRIALNMDQIERFNPPPNQVKTSDSRWKTYRKKYGDHVWELDALPPNKLDEIVETAIKSQISDQEFFDFRRDDEIEGRSQLRSIAENFDEALEYVSC